MNNIIKKIFFTSIITIFLIVVCANCIFLGILFFRPALLLPLCEYGLNTYACAKYYFKPYPSNEWVHCERIEGIWKYLENEEVQKIAFCGFEPETSPDKWRMWGEVVEPQNIRNTLQLIRAGKIDGYIGVICSGRMKIITDKYKFIIPVEWDDEEIFSYRWKSAELRKQLWKWNFPGPEYNYAFPPKEQTAAVLLYPHPSKLSPPLAFFGDKKLAEKLLFEPQIKDEPNGIKGIGDLYKSVQLRKFGFEFKKEAGEWITTSNELEPKKIFEGREWLEKIIDAYEIALKETEEREKYFPMKLDNSVGRIVFITRDGFYWKPIGVAENVVYDDYIESEQLKAYFDELGLVDELLSEKLSKEHQN